MAAWTAQRIRGEKGKGRLPCLTAYDALTGRLLDAAGIPLALVGDSLGMSVLGYETTLPVTVEEMLHHTAAVTRAVKNALVVADLPFMSYQISAEQALETAARFVRVGAGGVKLEGGRIREDTVARLTANGIPVLAHIGLTPQSLLELGGYKVQGRSEREAGRLLADAQCLAEAGAFAIVLECLPVDVARAITEATPIPTIGIGAGPHCDGQVLVLADALGFSATVSPRFVRRYADMNSAMSEAISRFMRDVREGAFPSESESYS